MADSNDIGILLKVLLDANTVDINKQIKTLSSKVDKLKIKLDIDQKEFDRLSSLAKKYQDFGAGSGNGFGKGTQEIGRYEKGLNNLIHLYKMKEVSDDKFLSTMEQLRSKTEFTTLSQKKQEQVIGLLTQAEKNYQKVVDQGSNINKKQSDDNEKQLQYEQKVRQAIAQQKQKEIDLTEKQLQYEQKVRQAIEQQQQTQSTRNFNYGESIQGIDPSIFNSRGQSI